MYKANFKKIKSQFIPLTKDGSYKGTRNEQKFLF